MKPQLLKMHTEPYSSFSFRNDSVPHVNNRWHLHAELELIYFKNGDKATAAKLLKAGLALNPNINTALKTESQQTLAAL